MVGFEITLANIDSDALFMLFMLSIIQSNLNCIQTNKYKVLTGYVQPGYKQM